MFAPTSQHTKSSHGGGPQASASGEGCIEKAGNKISRLDWSEPRLTTTASSAVGLQGVSGNCATVCPKQRKIEGEGMLNDNGSEGKVGV